MKYTINRCMKRPGLIDRARTYFLELNDKGLYIIAIGKAGQEPNIRQDNLVNVTAVALAKKLSNPMLKRMEEEILANEERLNAGKMDEMAQEKKSYFLKKGEVQSFNIKDQGKVTKISIKGTGVKIDLYADNSYSTEITGMAKCFC